MEERTAKLKEINQQLTQQIAERVRVESQRDATLEALRESEERYRTVSELTSIRFAPKGMGWDCPLCGASWRNSTGRSG